MADLLMGGSAVENRRMARKNIAIAIIVGLVSLLFCQAKNLLALVGFIGILYSLYLGILKGFISLWVYKE